MSYDIDIRSKHFCEHCGSTAGVEVESGRSAYHYDGVAGAPEDPNRNRTLCRPCAKEWHDHWDEMWSHARDVL